MPDRPLVLFGKPEDADKNKLHGGNKKTHYPSHSRQINRLSPQFQILQSVLDRSTLTMQDTPDGIDPEYTLVLETDVSPDDFQKVIRSLQQSFNIEVLFEIDDESFLPDDDFYYYTNQELRDGEKLLTFKCFCILTNYRALQEILSLWRNYKNNENFKFQRGQASLKQIFKSLRSIHLWGVEERFIETGTRKAWEEDLSNPDIENVKCEIELSYRRSSEKRIQSEKKVEDEIKNVNGRIVTKTCIEEIGYHAILAEIPRLAAQEMLKNKNISFLVFNEILFINPSGQTIVTTTAETFDFEGDLPVPDKISDEPVIALFDGLPQENHPILKDFLLIDDPDEYTTYYQIKDRQHGTAMASLIAWGELNNNPSAISRKIYARPILKPFPFINGTNEYVPDNVLLVDKIHMAVTRLYKSQEAQILSKIRVINLSIGIHNRPYYSLISPLARLLDWLSFKYKVLFIVSAGNYNDDIDLGVPFNDFAKLNETEKDKIIINAINNRAKYQKLLSPAESINSLTVGALFSDSSQYSQAGSAIMPCSSVIPGPYSALGRGINRSIKPDLILEGGRNTVYEDFSNKNIAHWGRVNPRTIPPGILHAKPAIPTEGKSVGYTFGTSNSTALLSHRAMMFYDILDEIFVKETEKEIPSEYASLLIKAMLVHGSAWGNEIDIFKQALGMSSRKDYSDKVHKFIGYGIPDFERVEECAKNRITIIGYGELEKEKAHLYAIPLPFDFSSRRALRKLTITMTYYTPIIPNTKKYKQAQIWFSLEDEKELIKKRYDASDKAVIRGTVQHERFYDDETKAWTSEDTLNVKVNCRENIPGLSDRVPYSIFITFEVAPELNFDVYTDVLDRIKSRDKVDAKIRG